MSPVEPVPEPGVPASGASPAGAPVDVADDFLAAVLDVVVFFAAAVFLAAVFFAVDGLAGALPAVDVAAVAFFAVDFLAVAFFVVDVAAAFLAGALVADAFLAGAFFAAVFVAGDLVPAAAVLAVVVAGVFVAATGLSAVAFVDDAVDGLADVRVVVPGVGEDVLDVVVSAGGRRACINLCNTPATRTSNPNRRNNRRLTCTRVISVAPRPRGPAGRAPRGNAPDDRSAADPPADDLDSARGTWAPWADASADQRTPPYVRRAPRIGARPASCRPPAQGAFEFSGRHRPGSTATDHHRPPPTRPLTISKRASERCLPNP